MFYNSRDATPVPQLLLGAQVDEPVPGEGVHSASLRVTLLNSFYFRISASLGTRT